MPQTKKIVVVAFPLGRTGSSAMMGLLKCAGVNIGDEKAATRPSPINPKGFFELRSHNLLLTEVYPGIYPDAVNPPPLATLQQAGVEHSARFLELIQTEFGEKYPIAIKSPRLLNLPFLHELRDQFDIRVLMMHRNLEDQVASTLRVWETTPVDATKKAASREFVVDFLQSWTVFCQQVSEFYGFTTLDVDFEKLINDPVASMQIISEFLDIACPPEQDILGWIDTKLFNRQVLPEVSSGWGLKSRFVNQAKAMLKALKQTFH